MLPARPGKHRASPLLCIMSIKPDNCRMGDVILKKDTNQEKGEFLTVEQEIEELLRKKKSNIFMGIACFIIFSLPFFIYTIIISIDKDFYTPYYFLTFLLFIIGLIIFSIIIFTNSSCPYCNKIIKGLFRIK
jgi:hypothetical protein